MTDFKTLRERAQRATDRESVPPWKVERTGSNKWRVLVSSGDDAYFEICTTESETIARYIAAASPDRLLSILDVIEEAKLALKSHALATGMVPDVLCAMALTHIQAIERGGE